MLVDNLFNLVQNTFRYIISLYLRVISIVNLCSLCFKGLTLIFCPLNTTAASRWCRIIDISDGSESNNDNDNNDDSASLDLPIVLIL